MTLKITAPIIILFALTKIWATDRPNILWITSEDNSHHYIGCYENQLAKTPNIDSLAAMGILFNHAYSNAPVCAVARSTILTGQYAVSQGTHHMRSRYAIPDHIKTYVHHLREAGYYCTNNSKMDYNTSNFGKNIWDESSNKAHYRNRAENQPFFAIFNFTTTHESRLFPNNISAYRERSEIPQNPRIDPSEIALPAYLPDEPIFREDIAIYQDFVTLMDQQVGQILKELENAGLAEDTIIFYYSDHGGVIPRTKRWLLDTGTHVPMIAYVPEKWKHLSPYPAGFKVDSPVAFVDLAPTLMNLIGSDIPEDLQGEPFLGYSENIREKKYAFLFGDRFDSRYKLRRGITDGEYRYVLNFFPYQKGVLPLRYPEGIRSWAELKDKHHAGIKTRFSELYLTNPLPAKQLYHTDFDPWEVNNLSADSMYDSTEAKLHEALVQKMKEIYDLGFIPEAMFHQLGVMPYDYARDPANQYHRIIDVAVDVVLQKISEKKLLKLTKDEHPLIRYWACMGLIGQGQWSPKIEEVAAQLMSDTYIANQALAHFASALLDTENSDKHIQSLIEFLDSCNEPAVLTTLLNYIDELDAMGQIPPDWLEANLKGDEYHKRIVGRYLRIKKNGNFFRKNP